MKLPRKPAAIHRPERQRHLFFLNPYDDMACTRCPKCERPTKLRKAPLAIHIEPDQFLALNKTCRYCPPCDLLIARQCQIEPLMAATFEERRPNIVGNRYLVFGTLDREDWRQYRDTTAAPSDVIDLVYVFRDVIECKMTGGWQLPPEKGHRISQNGHHS